MARILIGEPDHEVRQLLTFVVARLGHEPIQSGDADAADVYLFEPAAPACLELAQQLRREQPGLALVALSINPPCPRTRALAPIRHLMKPFIRSELAAALEHSSG